MSAAQRAVLQGQVEVQAAQSQVSETMAALQVARSAFAAAQQRLAELERWKTEIARDPLDRSALEQVAAELSAKTVALEESLAISKFQKEEIEQNLAALVGQRDLLASTNHTIDGQLPSAQTELQAAQAAFDAASAELFGFLDTGE